MDRKAAIYARTSTTGQQERSMMEGVKTHVFSMGHGIEIAEVVIAGVKVNMMHVIGSVIGTSGNWSMVQCVDDARPFLPTGVETYISAPVRVKSETLRVPTRMIEAARNSTLQSNTGLEPLSRILIAPPRSGTHVSATFGGNLVAFQGSGMLGSLSRILKATPITGATLSAQTRIADVATWMRFAARGLDRVVHMRLYPSLCRGGSS